MKYVLTSVRYNTPIVFGTKDELYEYLQKNSIYLKSYEVEKISDDEKELHAIFTGVRTTKLTKNSFKNL